LLTGSSVKVRDRSQATSPSLRKPEMLPPLELRAALLAVIEQKLGADRAEAVTSVSRAVGFRATSAPSRMVTSDRPKAPCSPSPGDFHEAGFGLFRTRCPASAPSRQEKLFTGKHRGFVTI
jgi:hypothetical protein